MSVRLKKELEQLTFVQCHQVDNEHYTIPMDAKIHPEENSCYLIKLYDSIFNPNSLLTWNWNNGRVPLSRYYMVEVNKLMANMIKISGVGYDTEDCTIVKDNWFGWLPLDEIDIIRKL